MNKKIVKLSTILIAVIILCFAASIMSGAVDAEGQCGDNIYWSFNSETGELAFNGSGNMWKYEKSSSVPWYKYSGSITTAKIGKNITSLDVVMTFAECDYLTTINVDVENAFYQSINGVLYNKDKTIIYRCPINYKSSTYTILDGVETVYQFAFADCRNLRYINIPESATELSNYSFCQSISLKEINISKNVSVIGTQVFYGCKSLENINVDEKNGYFHSIDGVLFDKNVDTLIQYPIGNKRYSYSIPNTVKFIVSYAFLDADKLTNIIIPDSVLTIGFEAIDHCDNLKELHIPASVKNIYTSFSNSFSMDKITVDENNEFYCDVDGVLYTKDLKKIVCYPIGKKQMSYTIIYGVEEIGSALFYGDYDLKEVVIPDTVKLIKSASFNVCSIRHVAYLGTEEQWNEICIENANNPILQASAVHCEFNADTDIKVVITEPTCTEKGEEKAGCSRCDYFETKEIKALGHNLGAYVVAKESSCNEKGEERAYCSRCDYFETKEIKALGHDMGAFVITKESTCNEKGEEKSTCSRCDYSETKAIKALGHNLGDYVVVKESTCSEKGEEQAECLRCDYIKTKAIALKQHIDANGDENCDVCELYLPSLDCLCVCHAKTIGAFMYKLFTVLDELFGTRLLEKVFHITSEYCDCGLQH